MSRRVAFLGGGKMGEALVSGLIRSGGRNADEIMVTARREERVRVETREEDARVEVAFELRAAELNGDAVIDPRETRPKIIRALEMLRNKTDSTPPKKHGNVPL